MSKRTKVTVRFDFLEKLKKDLLNQQFVSAIGKQVVADIKEATSVGLSPVDGVGRFVGYKKAEEAKRLKSRARQLSNKKQITTKASALIRKQKANSLRKQAKTALQGYPYSVMSRYPDKKVRPVNLRLSGSMLRAISYKMFKTNNSIKFYIEGEKQNLMAQTHNDGTQSDRVPQRKFLPNKPGDEFITSIMRSIIGLYRSRIKSMIEMSNKKR